MVAMLLNIITCETVVLSFENVAINGGIMLNNKGGSQGN